MKKLLTMLIGVLAGCSSNQIQQRVVIDSSGSRPSWTENSKLVWEQDGQLAFRSAYTVRGDERIGGCYDLARLQAKEALISEIQSDVRGVIDSTQQSISENAELVLGKSTTSEFSGKLEGLRFSEQYYERVKLAEREEVQCHILGLIKKQDYDKTKRMVISKLTEVDSELKAAIKNKHIDFFRTPASK